MSKHMHFASFDHDNDATILTHHLSQLVHPNLQKIKSVAMVSIYGIARSPLFPLGQITTTDAAAALLRETNTELLPHLMRHQCGDWGSVTTCQIHTNEAALHAAGCIRSVYELGEQKQLLWIVTDTDQRTTTAMAATEVES